jgi:hypothetical protein
MGNGPSLVGCDLAPLEREITIVSNANYLLWDQLGYVPTLLTAEDRLVIEDRHAELSALVGITTLFPFEFRGLLGPPSSEHLYVNFPRTYAGFPRFSTDLSRRAYWGGTVSFLNLQLAAYIGCNPIVLIGFDHSYAVRDTPGANKVIVSQRPDENHFHPDYFGPGYRWHDPDVARMEIAYRCARSALEARGVGVLNATVGGHLEVFERADYGDLLR